MLGKGTPLLPSKPQNVPNPKVFPQKSHLLSCFSRVPIQTPTKTPSMEQKETKETKFSRCSINLLIDFPFRIPDQMSKWICPFYMTIQHFHPGWEFLHYRSTQASLRSRVLHEVQERPGHVPREGVLHHHGVRWLRLGQFIRQGRELVRASSAPHNAELDVQWHRDIMERFYDSVCQ